MNQKSGAGMQSKKFTNPKLAALVGVLFILPYFILNAIIWKRIEPFFSLIGPVTHTRPSEYVDLIIVLLLILIGSFIAIIPVLQKKEDGKRKFYALNIVTAITLFIVFFLLSFGLGTDIYNCDILQIPNCD